jgi:hypothetical protein
MIAQRFIEASLASTIGPRAARERRHALRIDSREPLSRRAAQVLLHESVVRVPRVAACIAGVLRSEVDYEFVGEGYDAVVLREKGSAEVVKVHYRSASRPRQQQHTEAQARQAQFDAAAAELGGLSVPQRTEVSVHPVFPSIAVVTTRQPFIPHHAAGIYEPGSSEVRPRVLNALLEEVPNAADDLYDLIEGSNRLYDQTGLVPDTGGDNLVVTSARPHLVAIDGQPITTAYPLAQAEMLRGLDNLARSLVAA